MDKTIIKEFALPALVGVILGILAIIFDITFIFYEPYSTIIRVLQIIVVTSFVGYLVIKFVYLPIKNKRNNKNTPNNERTN